MLKKEFDILYHLLRHPEENSQRKLAAAADISLGTVNSTLKDLEQQGLVADGAITQAGVDALEEYRITNAIILAAGMSSRFLPLSLEKPKGLMVVKGETMIERQIKQLHEVGITDITVVVGYMKEKFFFLQDKYGVTLVENHEYSVKNNTSSLMLVLDKIRNTYICASDHYFTRNVFESHSFNTNYTVTYVEGSTTDFSYTLDKKGRFNHFETHSDHEMGLIGPCCFLKKDADHYVELLKSEYEKPSTWNMLWEDLLVPHITEFEMYPRAFEDGVIYEFDNLDELRKFDNNYINNLDSSIIGIICRELECEPADVTNFQPMGVGKTNVSFSFDCKGQKYVYRHPGAQTDQFLSRKCEAEAEKLAGELGLDPSVIAIDPETGWKLSHFIEGAEYLDPYDKEGDQKEIMRALHTLHDQKYKGCHDMVFIKDSEIYIDLLTKGNLYDFSPFMETHQQMKKLEEYMEGDGFERVLCHNDVWYWNFLRDKYGNIHLIDWEYAGNNYPAADVADHIVSFEDWTEEDYLDFAARYEGHELSEREVRFYLAAMATCGWYWFVWGIYQEATGTEIEDLKTWYDWATRSMKESLEMYERANA